MLDEKGFKRKRYNEIIESMNERARELFGDDINLGSRSPLGMFLRVVAWFTSQLWELAEKVYFSGYKDTAEGVSLDRVCQYIGIRRRGALKSVGEVTITGEDKTKIHRGFEISSSEIKFETTESGVITNGKVVLKARAMEAGASGNVAPNVITEIDNPIVGVDEVINLEDFRGGRDAETDAELRDRYDRTLALGGKSTIPALEAALLNMDDVRYAQVQENVTLGELNGIPGKSIAPFVFGGVDEYIAQTLFETKPGGIECYGDVNIAVQDSLGIEHIIGFSRPEEVNIFINANLSTNALFPEDGNETIRTEIIKYIGGLDEDSSDYTGLGLGDNVIYTQMIGLCHSVPGVIDVDLEISSDGSNFVKENILIDSRQVSLTDFNKVVIS